MVDVLATSWCCSCEEIKERDFLDLDCGVSQNAERDYREPIMNLDFDGAINHDISVSFSHMYDKGVGLFDNKTGFSFQVSEPIKSPLMRKSCHHEGSGSRTSRVLRLLEKTSESRLRFLCSIIEGDKLLLVCSLLLFTR
jgi:hypothetical protein